MAQSTKYTGLDENGDEIIFEGILEPPTKAICILTLLYIVLIVASMGFVFLALPCLIAIHYYTYFQHWRLYITHSDLHYGFGCTYTITPFSEINQISVVPGTKNIMVNKKHASIYASSHAVAISNVLRINGVANCKEFVAAVKAEMVRSQQQQDY